MKGYKKISKDQTNGTCQSKFIAISLVILILDGRFCTFVYVCLGVRVCVCVSNEEVNVWQVVSEYYHLPILKSARNKLQT